MPRMMAPPSWVACGTRSDFPLNEQLSWLAFRLNIDYSRYMEMLNAIEALEALAHETRLSVFRLLVKAGPDGLTAGAIAERLGARQNTMSSHLAKLHRAGIVKSERDGRHVIYRADFEAVSELIVYLMEDCCGGSAEVCAPVAASIDL